MLQLNFGASSIHKCKNVSFFLTLETCIIYLVPEVFTFMVDQNRSFCSIDFSQNLNSEHFECLELFLMNLVDLFIEEMLMISRSVFFFVFDRHQNYENFDITDNMPCGEKNCTLT